MTQEMVKFPSLEQFRTAISNVKRKAKYRGRDENGEPIIDEAAGIPTLSYRGTVKLHGTNAGIVWSNKEIHYQSRERILSLTQDNAGFMLFMENQRIVVADLIVTIMNKVRAPVDHVVIFGEWCGAGVQKGVAISEVPKMFVIFGIKINHEWVDFSTFDLSKYNENRIFSIFQFPTFSMSIDFNNPALIQNDLIAITEKVEAECPVGKHFGVSGIGEGVVWTCITEGWRSYDHAFKIKGEKHSVSKVKTLAAVDVEAVKALADFVDQVVTEARLEQGVWNLVHEQLKPIDMTSMGDFIRWVYNDVLKEEMDTIVASQFDSKKLGGPIANKARPWFINKVNSQC